MLGTIVRHGTQCKTLFQAITRDPMINELLQCVLQRIPAIGLVKGSAGLQL
jgi:hypothetical protein